MATRNYNTETTSPITTTLTSTDTTTSPATTLTTTPGFSPIETITTTNHSTGTTTSPATTMTSTASPVTTKKPLHISIGVNYKGFIKYTNITDISTLSGTTTKISKYVINVGKLVSTSTSSTSTLIDIIAPSSSVSPTTTKAIIKPTSIPPIQICAEDNGYHSGDVYLTYEANGAVYESDNVRSLPKTLTPVYDNSYFVFSSKYDWYYIKNGEKVEVLGGSDHEISLSVLRSTVIYIKVTSTTTSPTSTITETQQPSNTSTILNNSTTVFPST
jgi:hypothetical protein